MTSLATNRDLRVRRVKRVALEVETHAYVGRMALGTHVVPVLLRAGPVQGVVGRNVLVGVNVKPALTTLRLRTCIPRESERLQAAARKLDQVLLQRLDTEHVSDSKILLFSLLISCPHVAAVFTREESNGLAEIVNADIIKVAEHSVTIGDLHCQLVMGTHPVSELVLMTGLALAAADKRGGSAIIGGLRQSRWFIAAATNANKSGERQQITKGNWHRHTLTKERVLSYGIERDLQRVVTRLADELELPQTFISSALEHYVPLLRWLQREMQEYSGSTYLLGVHGAQGTGKTTLAQLLCRYIHDVEGRSVISVSIDDFYRTRRERQQLAKSVHPLLATRGVPGTHDVDLALATIRGVRALGTDESIEIPRFDKAADDRAPASDWTSVCGPVDLVILEGWCVGSEPANPESLLEPVNTLERDEDEDGTWRRFVNDSLVLYQPLFELIDGLLMLRAPSFETALKWRLEQERKLQRSNMKSSNRIMTETDIRRFVQFFERLTVASDATVAMKADVIVDLGTDHQPRKVDINS